MALLNDSGAVTLLSGANLLMFGGGGATGGLAQTQAASNLYLRIAGYGGNGGQASMNSGSLLTIASDVSMTLSGGLGGTGGSGNATAFSYGPAVGGGGGRGGDVVWTPTGSVALKDIYLNIYTGSGGSEGQALASTYYSKGGDGAEGGSIRLQGTFDAYEVNLFKVFFGSTGTEYSYGPSPWLGMYCRAGKGGGVTGDLILEAEDPDTFNFYDSVITLSQDLDIDFTWTITTDKKVYGNGNSIILGTGGEIVVDPNINLYLQNLSIDGVTGFEVRCLDDSSSITLDDVTINLDGNLSFTEGMLVIKGTCVIDGAGKTFLFQSSEPLLILNGATFKINPQVVFEYDTSPASLLQFGNSASTLFLDSSTLLATQALTLQTGTLSTDGLATLQGVVRLSFGGLGNFVIRGGLLRLGNVVI
jgi:hypothetical protein